MTQLLNSQQRQAVEHAGGHATVLAAPGSGKTTVLIARIAWLLDHGVLPGSITAITFTNRAASELSKRLERGGHAGPWSGTFHRLGFEIINTHGSHSGIRAKPTILDEAGALSAVRSALKRCGLTISRAAGTPALAGQLADLIERAKGRGEHPEALSQTTATLPLETAREVYSAYRDANRRDNLLDFADLLLLSNDLLERNEDALEFWRSSAQYLLVDEFQDVNPSQYSLVKNLSDSNTFIVADPHQSIYAWRGADPEIVERFTAEFAATRYMCDLNYRSRPEILTVASQHIGSSLQATQPNGGVVRLLGSRTEYTEAEQIAGMILDSGHQHDASANGEPLSRAVLCRHNQQIRVFEQVFLRRGVRCRVVSNNSYWNRVEVKIAASILQLALNPSHNPALEYLITHAFHPQEFDPTLKLGQTSLDKLSSYAALHDLPLVSALEHAQSAGLQKAGSAAAHWLYTCGVPALLETSGQPAEIVSAFLKLWGYTAALERRAASEDSDTRALAIGRQRGMTEFLELCRAEPDLETLTLKLSLNHTANDTDTDAEPRVDLLTVHAAKGLEWDEVYIPGLNEGTYPASFSDLEAEERRLLYVALTRARSSLTLSHHQERRSAHGWEAVSASRYLAGLRDALEGRTRPSSLPESQIATMR